MNYKKFEQSSVWQRSRELCKFIFKIINLDKFQKDYNLRDQICCAAGSVMDNITEGCNDGSQKELIRFLGYSQRSCSEVHSQLYRALDCEYIDDEIFHKEYNLASDCRKQIKGFRKYLRNYNK